jgi:hypothetical protein
MDGITQMGAIETNADGAPGAEAPSMRGQRREKTMAVESSPDGEEFNLAESGRPKRRRCR